MFQGHIPEDHNFNTQYFKTSNLTSLEDVRTSLVAGWLSFLVCILEVPVSNLGHDNN
jgi:hypothetical protein